MTEELVFKRKMKNRTRYTRYYINHDEKSLFLITRYSTGKYMEYEIHATIMINANTLTSEILDKIEKESVKLFKETYDSLKFRKTYNLIAIILLLLIRYKIIKRIHLVKPGIVKISYYVIIKREYKKTYNLKPDNFLNLIKKLNKFFDENKIYEKIQLV